MPLYQFACEACGATGETVVLLRDYDPAGLPCPECGQMARRGIAAAVLTGPTDTKPLVVEHMGETFTSNKQVEQYMRDNPGWQMRSATDSTYRAFHDRAREKCERTARRLGYRDLEHRRASERQETARRQKR